MNRVNTTFRLLGLEPSSMPTLAAYLTRQLTPEAHVRDLQNWERMAADANGRFRRTARVAMDNGRPWFREPHMVPEALLCALVRPVGGTIRNADIVDAMKRESPRHAGMLQMARGIFNDASMIDFINPDRALFAKLLPYAQMYLTLEGVMACADALRGVRAGASDAGILIDTALAYRRVIAGAESDLGFTYRAMLAALEATQKRAQRTAPPTRQRHETSLALARAAQRWGAGFRLIQG